MTSQNIEYLREHGPTTTENLPNTSVSVTDRQNGVWKFNASPNGSGTPPQPVYYLRDEHDLEAVVEVWLTFNADIVRRAKRDNVRWAMRQAGRNFHDAIDEVYPPRGEA